MIDEIIDKYSDSVLNNISRENMKKIINFLKKENCDFIEDIIEDYLDLFTFEYEEFVDKYNKLNTKYNNNLLELASSDMNILEEFYTI